MCYVPIIEKHQADWAYRSGSDYVKERDTERTKLMSIGLPVALASTRMRPLLRLSLLPSSHSSQRYNTPTTYYYDVLGIPFFVGYVWRTGRSYTIAATISVAVASGCFSVWRLLLSFVRLSLRHSPYRHNRWTLACLLPVLLVNWREFRFASWVR